MTVKELRQAGYTVKVRHNRSMTRIGGNIYVLPKGGLTEVNIYLEDYLIGSGTAKCSKNDNYNRKRGVQIALGRALKTMNQIIGVMYTAWG